MHKLIAIGLFLISQPASALMCYVKDSSGVLNYRFVGKPTVYLSGTTAKIKPCVIQVGLRVESSHEDARCLASAMAACDSTWGGVKLMLNPTVPESDNQCLHFKVSSGTDDTGLLYYRRLQVYSTSKPNPDGTINCN